MRKFFYIIAVLAYASLCFDLAFLGKPAELAGFTVAGALALVFLNLDAFVEFSGAGFSAKMKQRIDALENDIEPIKSKETEPDVSSDKPERLSGVEDTVDQDSMKVLSALATSKYSWRTMRGLKTETGLSSEHILDILHELEEKGLAVVGKLSAGKNIWGATMRGYIFASMQKPSA